MAPKGGVIRRRRENGIKIADYTDEKQTMRKTLKYAKCYDERENSGDGKCYRSRYWNVRKVWRQREQGGGG